MPSHPRSAHDKGNGHGMAVEDLRDLEVLDAVAQDRQITQRHLAARLGIALGLANLYIKRLARKGFIKCVNVQSNRLLYLITPHGITEKTRLTYEYMEYSLDLYHQVRGHLRIALRPLASEGKRVAICGVGEAAELAYISLREAGLDPVAIFDGAGPKQFLGLQVHDIRDHTTVDYDLVIVATFMSPETLVAQLVDLGVPREKVVTLTPISPGKRQIRRTANHADGV